MREEVSEIAREVRAEAERFGRERDREGTVFFEVRAQVHQTVDGWIDLFFNRIHRYL